MITAKEASEKSELNRLPTVNANEQFSETMEWIEKAASIGQKYVKHKTELHEDAKKRLEKLGYEIRNGIIYWSKNISQ